MAVASLLLCRVRWTQSKGASSISIQVSMYAVTSSVVTRSSRPGVSPVPDTVTNL